MKRIVSFVLVGCMLFGLAACSKKEPAPVLTVPIDVLAPNNQEVEPETAPSQLQQTENISTTNTEDTLCAYLDSVIVKKMTAPQTPNVPENPVSKIDWTNLIQDKKGTILPTSFISYSYGLPTAIMTVLEDGTQYTVLQSHCLPSEVLDVPLGTVLQYGLMIEPDGTTYVHSRQLYKDTIVKDDWFSSSPTDTDIVPAEVIAEYFKYFIEVDKVCTANNTDYVDIFCFDSERSQTQYADNNLNMLLRQSPEKLIKITLVANATTKEIQQAYFGMYDNMFKRYEYTTSCDYTQHIDIQKPSTVKEKDEDSADGFLGLLLASISSTAYAQLKYYADRELTARETDGRAAPDGIYSFSEQQSIGPYSKFSFALYDGDNYYSYDYYGTEIPQYIDDYNDSLKIKLDFTGPVLDSWSLIDPNTNQDLGHPTEEELRSKYRPKEKYVWQDGELVLINPKPKQDGLYNYYVSEERIRLSNVTYRLQYDYDRGENELLESFAEYDSQIYLQITFNEQEIQSYEVVLRDTLTNLGQISPQEVDYYLHPEKYATQVKAGTLPDHIFLSDYPVNTVHAFSSGDSRHAVVINESEYNLIKIVSWTGTQEPRIEYISNVGQVTKQNAQKGFVDLDTNRGNIIFSSSSDTPPNETIYMYITPIEVEDYIKGLEIRDGFCKKMSSWAEEEILSRRRDDCIYNDTSNSYTIYSDEHSDTVDIKPGQIFISDAFSIYDLKIRKIS